MAIEIDPYVARRIAKHPNVLWHKLTSPLRRGWRSARKRSSRPPRTGIAIRAISARPFAIQAGSLASDGWTFAVNVLSAVDHAQFVASWPERHFFDPLQIRQKAKTYDVGFRLLNPSEHTLRSLDCRIEQIYRYFASPTTAAQITELAGDGVERRCYSLLANWGFWGSGLAPHRDTPAPDATGADRRINIVYFVDANGTGWDAGGTSILRTNDFSEPMFVPQNLNNSILIYRTGDQFFHGFPPMKYRTYRRVITAHYCPSSERQATK
jgi:hypothetical protein